MQVDVRSEESLKTFFHEVGEFHHLVITAAEGIMVPFKEAKIERAKEFFLNKFWGQYSSLYYALPYISKEGSVTFCAGVESRRATPGLSCASAIDAALEALSTALEPRAQTVRFCKDIFERVIQEA